MTTRIAIITLTLVACSHTDDSNCVAGARICSGDTVLLCSPQTHEFEIEQFCPPGQACNGGKCIQTAAPQYTIDGGTTADTSAPITDLGVSSDPKDASEFTDAVSTQTTDMGPEADIQVEPQSDGRNQPDLGCSNPTDVPPTPTPDAGVNGNKDTSTQPETTTIDDASSPVPPDTTAPNDAPPGFITYQKVSNFQFKGDLHRLKWHPSGSFALLLGSSGDLVRYSAINQSLTLVDQFKGSPKDIAVTAAGDQFVIIGQEQSGMGQIWNVTVNEDAEQLTMSPGSKWSNGMPVAIEYDADSGYFGVAASAGNNINYLAQWSASDGIAKLKGYNSCGVADIMWASPSLYGGSPALITSDGDGCGNSHTWILNTNTVVTNNYKGGFGNACRSGWRPNGDYGIVAGCSSNKLYIYDGTWQMVALPNTNTGGNPLGIAWKSDGSRAIIVGRPTGSPIKGTVIEHRPGKVAAFNPASFLDVSIPGYGGAPWQGNNNTHLLDADWRPGSCDEGLIVGADSGTGFNPSFGQVIRFYDMDDPACEQ